MVSYVNTTAAVKALTDVVVTSSNAKLVIDSFPEDEKLIFGPDKKRHLRRKHGAGDRLLPDALRPLQLWRGH